MIGALNRTPSRPLAAVFTVAAIGAGGAVGYLGAQSEKLGVAALAALALLIIAAGRPVRLAVAALLGTFVVQRVGAASFAPGSSGGISYSDALLAVATLAALPAVLATREFRRLTAALIGSAVYLAMLLPGVFVDHSKRAALEWSHRFVLVIGALIVGAWLVQEGLVKPALRWFVCVAGVIAVLALDNSVSRGFEAASPLQMHKNFVGSQLAAALVLLVVARGTLAFKHRTWVLLTVVTLLGLLASQSRGAQLGAALAIAAGFFFSDRTVSRRARVLGIFAVSILGYFVYASVHEQLTAKTAAERKNDSIGVRFQVEEVTRDIWRTSPWVGVGLKYFNTGEYGEFAQPANNVIDNELAESGLIGAAGFVTFQVTVITAGFRRRRGNGLALAGAALVAGQLLHGQVDIYWTAGVAALPFLVLGMGLATRPRETEPPARDTAKDSVRRTWPGPRPVGAHRSSA